MSQKISNIYDLAIKRILELSSGAVVGLINGLYDEAFPVDNSKATPDPTENINDDMGHTFSDKMLTITSGDIIRRFHIEAEISSDDKEIVLKVFDYGYQSALKKHRTKDGVITLSFPQPKIIYLEHWSTAPDEVVLELDFWGQGTSRYTVPTMKFLDYSVEELDKRKMAILLPLYLLKLRRKIENAKEKGTAGQYVEEIRSLLNVDILGTLSKNLDAGNITHRDIHALLNLLIRLYNHLYGEIKEFQDGRVKSVIDDRLLLETDVLISETAENIAKELLLENVDISIIAKTTKLSRERVLEIKESLAVLV